MNTRNMILIAIFTALTAIGAFIQIPIPYVPVTLQLFFCAFAGFLLGARNGMLSQLIYVIIGLSGVPIFTKGGGLGYIFQPTFGYLLGFILCAYLIGKLTEGQEVIEFKVAAGAMMAGVAAVYLIGVPYLYLMLNFYLGKTTSLATVFYIGFLSTIGKDVILGFLIAAVVPRIVRILRSNNLA